MISKTQRAGGIQDRSIERSDGTTLIYPGHIRDGAAIGIFGNFGTGNYGNEATLQAMLDVLRRVSPDSETRCLCVDPATTSAHHGIAAVPIRYFPKPLQWRIVHLKNRLLEPALLWRGMSGISVLIIPGTAPLEDVGVTPQGLPLSLFWVCLLARLKSIKIAFVSSGAGPITNPISRFFLATAYSLAHYRTLRDEYSRLALKRAGIAADGDRIFPDLAYVLDCPPRNARRDTGKVAVIGVMKMRGGDDNGASGYVARLQTLGQQLIERGFSLQFVVGEATDRVLASRLVSALGPLACGHTTVSEMEASTFSSICRVASAGDVVIATRFHNVLAGLKMGVPTISIGYSPRHDELAERGGFGQFARDVATFDPLVVAEQADLLVRDGAAWRVIATERSSATRSAARAQEAEIGAFIAAAVGQKRAR